MLLLEQLEKNVNFGTAWHRLDQLNTYDQDSLLSELAELREIECVLYL